MTSGFTPFIKKKTKYLLNLSRCLLNRIRLPILLKESRKLHLGCGDNKMKGFLNIDIRPTSASDIINNASRLDAFPSNTFRIVFSNAFFEHLYYLERPECLKNVNRVLRSDGLIIFIGIPDFRQVADAYINKKPGITSKTFTLEEVYRYTHGYPEQVPDWWMAQLHKSLFDTETLNELLISSGFKTFVIFNYCFVNEKLPLMIGFCASKEKHKRIINLKVLADILKKLTNTVDLNTLKIVNTRK